MNRPIFLTIILVVLVISSCSAINSPPKLTDPEKGIIAIKVIGENTTRKAFTRYFRIYASEHPEINLKIFPKRGKYFVFSSEFPAGKYQLNRIDDILDGRAASFGYSGYPQRLSGRGVLVEIEPSSITIFRDKLYIDQFPSKEDNNRTQWRRRFQTITDPEMLTLIEELKEFDSTHMWEITN